MALIRRHGRRSYRTKGAGIRERLLGVVRILLITPDSTTLKRQTIKARRLISHPLCPPWIRIQTVEFLRTLNDFRAYLIHPELNLPTTNNSIPAERLSGKQQAWRGHHNRFYFARRRFCDSRNLLPATANFQPNYVNEPKSFFAQNTESPTDF
ncbi:MAG: hypothetical protein HYX20_04115 [Candidatus Yanofskybacteria bacterium]|nr:hypothetical protein [Candidatus Yanofskybacteria bacterium]